MSGEGEVRRRMTAEAVRKAALDALDAEIESANRELASAESNLVSARASRDACSEALRRLVDVRGSVEGAMSPDYREADAADSSEEEGS